MSPLSAPCKDCPDRKTLCHAECPKYLEYHAERELIRTARKAEQEIHDYIIDSVSKTNARIKKRNKRK